MRSQAEKKRKTKKTVVQGVAKDVVLDTPAGADGQAKESMPNDVHRPGLGGDEAPPSEMDDSAINSK